ncbi:DEAD/DEAH box helicase [Candidatus Dojkabacteria bacterium]|jgi:superfamily II DNA/RNA helicase|nr:DEAD/DEAH box helicase [Candidatus Dojkabacteria bacterium]
MQSYYNRNASRGFSGSRSFGGNRGGGGRQGGFRGRGGRSGGRRPQEVISVNKYINKQVKESAKVEFVPSYNYSDLKVNPTLKQNIISKGYTVPTPIQDQAIAAVMNGKDVLGIANTGTGKTAAFLIPLLEKVIKNRQEKILIITPTRELASQINSELFSLTARLGIYSVECTGGNPIYRQIDKLRRGFNFVVGTPGRLMDLAKQRKLDFSRFNNLVLDEVDRMLDMGFIDDIKGIIAQLPSERQTLFFSATVDRKIEVLIQSILKKDFVKISVTTGETAENVFQDVVYFRDMEDKINKLESILKDEKTSKTLVFVNTKRFVDRLDEQLYKRGHRVCAIHGDKRQNFRTRAISNFKTGVTDILIATDVAARGLDIPSVSHVINFDEPNSYQDYIHRIGRTGRAGKAGIALTFVMKKF